MDLLWQVGCSVFQACYLIARDSRIPSPLERIAGAWDRTAMSRSIGGCLNRIGLLSLAALLVSIGAPRAGHAQPLAASPTSEELTFRIWSWEVPALLGLRAAAEQGLPPGFSVSGSVTPPLGTSPIAWRLPTSLQQDEQRSGWLRGLLVGGLIGIAAGIGVHAVVDSMPCDSCSEGRSAAEGTRLEFALLFGAAGAGLGALIAR